MKLRSVGVIAAIVGGLLYLHVRAGGELTVESVKERLRGLLGRARREAEGVGHEVEKKGVHEVATTVAEATE